MQEPSVDTEAMSHAEWSQMCWRHVVGAYRGRRPILCDLDAFLPWDLLDASRLERLVAERLAQGNTTKFRSLGRIRQTRVIELRDLAGAVGRYQTELADSALWEDVPDGLGGAFSFLKPFIERLPFITVGRAVLICSNTKGHGVLHVDHDMATLQNEFIWIAPTGRKTFFLYYGGRRHPVVSRSCWFDSRHWHQSEESDELEISMRIDGTFTDEFRQIVVRSSARTLGLAPPHHVAAPQKGFRHTRQSWLQRAIRLRHSWPYSIEPFERAFRSFGSRSDVVRN
jgi:hypothetical protein